MNPFLRAGCFTLLWPGLVLAQAPAPATPSTSAAAPAAATVSAAALRQAADAAAPDKPNVPEPRVQRTVVEDDANRVEELNVRGQTRSVVVTPKGVLGGSYEIHTGDPSREMSADADPRRGTAGQRMWRLFSF